MYTTQVKDVCVLVALRSAKMVAVGLDGLLTHSGWKENTLRDLATLRAAGGGHLRGSLEPVPDWHSGKMTKVGKVVLRGRGTIG